MNYLILCLLLIPGIVRAGDAPSSRRYAVIPVIAGSAETSLQLGAFAAFFPPATDSHPSSINAVVIGSIKKQFLFGFAPDLYFRQNRYHLEGFISSHKWPANDYGTGNLAPDLPAKYKAQGIEIQVSLQRRFSEHLFIGPYHHILWETVEFDTPGAMPATGATGGRAVGLGLWAVYDTRDNPNAPRTGRLVRYTGLAYRNFWGSDFRYQAQTFEARTYLPIGDQSTLALASYLRHIGGDAPFRDLSTPDGIFIFRGIEKGRYRDRHVLTFQSEYRFPLRGKFGLTAFAELAQVAPALDAFALREFKTSIGGGLRYALNPAQRFNARLDANWVDGGLGITVSAREAF